MNDGESNTESCGRCSMSTVVDAANSDKPPEERTDHDPFGEDRIEVDESAIRRVSPGGYLADLKRRLDEFARRITYGK